MDLNKEFDELLDDLSLAVIQKIHSRVLQANAPSTIKKKGFDFPLVETTALLSDISSWREGKSGHVGVKGENAFKLEIAELGLDPHAPVRAPLRLAVDEDFDKILEKFAEITADKFEEYLR